jgi:hypothetical protein
LRRAADDLVERQIGDDLFGEWAQFARNLRADCGVERGGAGGVEVFGADANRDGGAGGDCVMGVQSFAGGAGGDGGGIHVAGTAKFPAPVIAEAKRKALELEGPGGAVDASEAAAGKRQRVTTAMTAFAGRTVASFVAAAAANTLRSEMRAMFPVQPVPVAV